MALYFAAAPAALSHPSAIPSVNSTPPPKCCSWTPAIFASLPKKELIATIIAFKYRKMVDKTGMRKLPNVPANEAKFILANFTWLANVICVLAKSP